MSYKKTINDLIQVNYLTHAISQVRENLCKFVAGFSTKNKVKSQQYEENYNIISKFTPDQVTNNYIVKF